MGRVRFAANTGLGKRISFQNASGCEIPGTPVASVAIPSVGLFQKTRVCGVHHVSQTLELVSGSSARKGMEVQVLPFALQK